MVNVYNIRWLHSLSTPISWYLLDNVLLCCFHDIYPVVICNPLSCYVAMVYRSVSMVFPGSYGEQSPSQLEGWPDTGPQRSGDNDEDQLRQHIADAMTDLRDTKHSHTHPGNHSNHSNQSIGHPSPSKLYLDTYGVWVFVI